MSCYIRAPGMGYWVSGTEIGSEIRETNLFRGKECANRNRHMFKCTFHIFLFAIFFGHLN